MPSGHNLVIVGTVNLNINNDKTDSFPQADCPFINFYCTWLRSCLECCLPFFPLYLGRRPRLSTLIHYLNAKTPARSIASSPSTLLQSEKTETFIMREN